MNDAYRRARVYVIAACLAVAVTGFFIVRGFAHHITVTCDGVLESIDRSHAEPVATTPLEENSGLSIAYDIVAVGTQSAYKHESYRVRWMRPNGDRTCSDLGFSAKTGINPSSTSFSIARGPDVDTYDVLDRAGTALTTFHKVERHSWRFVDHDKLVDAGDIGLLVLLGAMSALGLAVIRILSARGYATRMFDWTSGTVRSDGVVESESGSMMGRLAPKIRNYGTELLVNRPKQGAYRDIALLEKRDIAWGSHADWQKATSRRLRDARVLAVIATLTTLFAVLANQFAG